MGLSSIVILSDDDELLRMVLGLVENFAKDPHECLHNDDAALRLRLSSKK